MPNALKPVEQPNSGLPQVTDLSGGLLDVISRAARDPSVDIDKMERLLEMQERVHARNAKMAFNRALAEMQPNLPVIDERGGIKDRSGRVQSTYALWEDVNEAIRPILASYGFALTFKVRRTESEIVTTGVLSHCEGHCEESELSLPSDTSGSKNAVQAIGSSSTYGKRYVAYALLNITTKGQDDNGAFAGADDSISVEQLDEIQRLASQVGADLQRFCAYMKVNSLAALPAKRFNEAVDALRAKRSAK